MKKRQLIILCAAIASVLLIGFILWGKSAKAPDNSGNTNDYEDGNEENDGYEEPANYEELSVYTINYSSLECEPSVIVVPKDTVVDENYIVKEVIANFKETVDIDSIIKQDGTVTVSFVKGSAPAANVSTAMEAVMLDCIAYSLMDNVNGCQKIYFRIEDAPYTGIDITLGYDEPYISSDITEE
ncbi:MAG: hypothetical protein HFH14_09715 [Lachnospiraceae bacterium]|nr:hypothetical protein [Lachnospiraceae bacterium]